LDPFDPPLADARVISDLRSSNETDIATLQSHPSVETAIDIAIDRGELTLTSSAIDVIEARESLILMLEADYQNRLVILNELKAAVLSRAFIDPTKSQVSLGPQSSTPSGAIAEVEHLERFLVADYAPTQSDPSLRGTDSDAAPTDLSHFAIAWDAQPGYDAHLVRTVAAILELARNDPSGAGQKAKTTKAPGSSTLPARRG